MCIASRAIPHLPSSMTRSVRLTLESLLSNRSLSEAFRFGLLAPVLTQERCAPNPAKTTLFCYSYSLVLASCFLAHPLPPKTMIHIGMVISLVSCRNFAGHPPLYRLIKVTPNLQRCPMFQSLATQNPPSPPHNSSSVLYQGYSLLEGEGL